MEGVMIRTEKLAKRYGEVLAVDALDLEVTAGEVFGFLGPNGAGKTTTLRMLAALIAPTAGEAWVAGCQIGRQDRTLRGHVGILTEAPGLYDRLSAERNLTFFAELYEVEDVAGQVERYLRMLGLWDRRGQEAGVLSKGMRQKLAIARALLHEPRVLFLDEPTSGLDPEAARLVRDFIAGLKREGRTIFMCTHNLAEADRLCDRIAVFNQHILALDTPAGLRQRFFRRTVVFHLRAASEEHVRAIQSFPFVQDVERVDAKLVVALEEPEAHNPTLVRALVEAGAEVQFVGELRRSLEEVYLRLVKGQGPDSEQPNLKNAGWTR
jgi:ABC-2 type transport system ATP-binding protein